MSTMAVMGCLGSGRLGNRGCFYSKTGPRQGPAVMTFGAVLDKQSARRISSMARKPTKFRAGSRPLQLGRAVPWPTSPDKAVLDRVPNPQSGTSYLVRFVAPEFTAMCPVTGQPDFAHLVIDYVPRQWLLESKSLKLYLASLRNHA